MELAVSASVLERRPRCRRQQVSVILLVVLLHVVALVGLLSQFGHTKPISATNSAELAVKLIYGPRAQIADTAPTPEPTFAKVPFSATEEPQIKIEDDRKTVPAAIAGNPFTTVPPRPDPYYLNPNPPLPAQWRSSGKVFQVTLLIFVESDGHVSTSSVRASSGKAELDRDAQNFVRSNWRFRPAQNGLTLIADWTTVLVTFV